MGDWFPIMDAPDIPWQMIEPHERQAARNHGQPLKLLAERGGLSASEAVCVLTDRRWREVWGSSSDGWENAGVVRLSELVDEWRKRQAGFARGAGGKSDG